MDADIDRCRAEIRRCESALLNGDTPEETHGILIGLADWTSELRLLQQLQRGNLSAM